MPGFGVISTTSDTFSPAAAPAVAAGVVIPACFESSPPRNCSDGALWANTTLDEHRTARIVFPIASRLYLENHKGHKAHKVHIHRFVASYKVLAPPPIAAPTSAPFLPPITPPMPAPAAVDPPTISAVFFQSPPSRCALRRAEAGVEL